MKRLLIKTLRKTGIEILRFSPDCSDAARMQRILTHHNIDLVLDVGANVGQYGNYLREIGYVGKIVSFEPLADAYTRLLSASKKDPLWEIAPRAAIGKSDGETTIHISRNSVSSSILPMLDSHMGSAPESAYVASEKVAMYKLDTIAPRYLDDKYKSIYLKIDVQGLETQVLEGALKILPGIKGLQLELSLVPLYEGEPLFKEMLERMDQLGYELYAIIPGFTDLKSGRLLQFDGIFFRKV